MSKTQRVEALLAPDINIDDIPGVLDLDALGVLAQGCEQKVLDLADLLSHDCKRCLFVYLKEEEDGPATSAVAKVHTLMRLNLAFRASLAVVLVDVEEKTGVLALQELGGRHSYADAQHSRWTLQLGHATLLISN